MTRRVAMGAVVVAVPASTAATPTQVTMLVRPTVVGGEQSADLRGTVGSRSPNEVVTIQATDCRSVTLFWRKRVLIQRFDRRLGRWMTIRSVLLTETGFSNPQTGAVSSWAEFKAPRVQKGSVRRAVFPRLQARPCYLGGVSKLLRT